MHFRYSYVLIIKNTLCTSEERLHWPKMKRDDLSKRLIEIGGAASKFSAIKSQTFDQMLVETDYYC